MFNNNKTINYTILSLRKKHILRRRALSPFRADLPISGGPLFLQANMNYGYENLIGRQPVRGRVANRLKFVITSVHANISTIHKILRAHEKPTTIAYIR